MIRQKSIIAVLATVATIGACSDAPPVSTDAGEQADSSAPTNRIDIPAIVRSNLGITFANVDRREVAATIRVPGAFELHPLARHEYRMTLPGWIDLLVDQYQEVEPGDLLYRFRSPKWPELQHEIIVGEQQIESAQAEIDVARERISEAEARLELMHERIATLASADFRQAELEAQAADLETSIPRLQAEMRLAETTLSNAQRTREHALHVASAATGIAESQLAEQVTHDGHTLPAYQTINWIEVRATEAGVVQTLQMTDGAYVEPPSIVVTTVNPNRVRFRAMGLQSDLPRLRPGSPSRIVPPRIQGIDIDDSISATLTIGLEAHPDQRTVTLLAAPAETRSWSRPGVSAFLEVVTDSTGGPALAIPRSAIVKDGIVHVFFRRDPDDPNKAMRVEADMGVSDGRWVAINSGLMATDEVVLDGAYELKLASEQSGVSQQGGHFHADGTFHGEH